MVQINPSPPPLQNLKACPLSPCLTLPKIVMLSMIGKGWGKENEREMKLFTTSESACIITKQVNIALKLIFAGSVVKI